MKYEQFEFEKEPVERRKKKKPVEMLSDLKHRYGVKMGREINVSEFKQPGQQALAMGSHESVSAFKKRVGW